MNIEGQMLSQKRKRLGEFLKEKRLGSNLTQAELAKALNYSTSQFISNWERGLSEPPIDKIRHLMTHLGFSKKEIVELLVEETKNFYEATLDEGKKKKTKRNP